MESYKIENLTFSYPSGVSALKDVNFEIKKGEFVLLCGTSGCGKTTLLRLLKPLLAPKGEKNGKILFEGSEAETLDRTVQAEKIGFVMQNPDNQLVCDKVWHELAFGAESLGMDKENIRMKVAEMASFFGIEDWFYKNVNELSGGQKQLLNLASVMVTEPSVIILDEPTSQLDPIASQEFISAVMKINREIGITIIMSEHSLEEAFSLADKVIVMENGKILFIGEPKEVPAELKRINSPMLDALPTAARVAMKAADENTVPLTVKEGREWLSDCVKLKSVTLQNNDIENGEKIIELKGVYFRYEKNSTDVIRNLNLKINKGEIYSVLGGNGSGKTTTLSLLIGINKAQRGSVKLLDKSLKISMLPQNPQALFIEKTVHGELCEVLDTVNLPENEKKEKICKVILLCNLESLLYRHPYDLSGGETQRVGLAKVLLTSPDVLILDEPTKGLDAHFKKKLGNLLKSLKKSGVTIIIVSHDVEFCAEYSDRCALFFDGGIVSENTPHEFFSGKSFYTTAANRMSRNIIDNAVLADDIVFALTGRKTEESFDKSPQKPQKPQKEEPAKIMQKDVNPPKKTIKTTLISLLVLLVLIPATIIGGKYILGSRKYYIISLLILLEISVPFFLSFEKRKPSAREVVLISTLAALTAAGRVVLFAFPQFKPMAALIVITGMCLGAESGFLVGALSLFASNFFLSQGPWTPWQMFGFGFVGFLAGMIGKTPVKKSRILVTVWGALLVLLVYAPIVNFGNVMMMYPQPTWELFKTAVVMGFPFDSVHAASTAFFLVLAYPIIRDKLNRIKVKYDLYKRM